MRPRYKNDFKLIRFIVYSMAALIIIGSLAVTSLIYNKSQEAEGTIAENAKTCKNSEPKFDGNIKSVSIDGDKIAFVIEKSYGKQKIIIYDYCKGEQIAEVGLSSEIEPKAQMQQKIEETHELVS